MKNSDWEKFIDESGNVDFSSYLYKTINSLMKQMLDLGTLACSDRAKLRAYKEQVKSIFRDRWTDMASLLQELGIVEPCSCDISEYCTICGGSRFVLSEDVKDIGYVIEEMGTVFSRDHSVKEEELNEQGEKEQAGQN